MAVLSWSPGNSPQKAACVRTVWPWQAPWHSFGVTARTCLTPSLLGKGCPKAEETPRLRPSRARAALPQVAGVLGHTVSFLPGWRMRDPAVSTSPWRKMRLTNWSWDNVVTFAPITTSCHLWSGALVCTRGHKCSLGHRQHGEARVQVG